MGVELFITRKGGAVSDYYSMTGATGWKSVWLPAAAEVGLDLIPLLGDGAFTYRLLLTMGGNSPVYRAHPVWNLACSD